MIDPKVIRDQLLNILLAGRDTTSCLLTFVTYIMALHPDVTRKMRAEVLKLIGPTRAPTIDDIKELRYGECCAFSPSFLTVPCNTPCSARSDQ